jgi:hypothetical protein
MCAALAGEPNRASALVDQARDRQGVTGIDLMLAEKVVGAGAQARRAASVEWGGVQSLSPWRFGLASATGTSIPPQLLASGGPRYSAWLARAPMVPLDQRLDAASDAAVLGVFSSRSLVEAYSLSYDETDPADLSGSVAARLRSAWVEGSTNARLAAMNALWREQGDSRARYGRLILTAGAAARIEPSSDRAASATDLVASMLAAGFDTDASRWGRIIEDANDQRGWALLAVGAPRAVDVGADRIQSFIDDDSSAGKLRSKLLVAALAGLGRIDRASAGRLGAAAGLSVPNDRWSAAIDEAARAGEAGTVALLAATGMQVDTWDGVPPAYLFRIVRDLKAVGLEFEARMIAAEAIART